MPDLDPLNSSAGDRPRRREIPPAVRRAIALMVRGRDDDELCTPLNLVTASREAGIKPHLFRKYLDRPECRALLLRERKIFRDAICASNEAALKRVRDTSANGMSVVASVRALENLADEAAVRDGRSAQRELPGVVIRIVASESTSAPTIDVTAFDGPAPSPTLPVPFPGPLVERPDPSPDGDDPMGLQPPPLRRRW